MLSYGKIKQKALKPNKERNKLKAIEFITKSEDGYIKIPKIYSKQLKQKFRVLILLDEIETKAKKTKTKRTKRLKAVKIKTKGLKFNREELHER